MANKFTKLTLGDIIASIGSKCFKRLSVLSEESVGVRLLTSDCYVLTDTNGLLITTKEDK